MEVCAWLLFYSLFLLMMMNLTEGCNEAVCASIVSKCTLLKSCDCDISATNCSCCKKCYACLGYLHDECCSCVGLCKDSKDGLNGSSHHQHPGSEVSQVAKLMHPDASLFQALTQSGDDELGRWTSITFPFDLEIGLFQENQLFLKVKDKFSAQNYEREEQSTLSDNIATFNCTVSYLSQCRSMNKCKKSCESMGAASYRWFHDSCCECVGSTCINYGIDESRCSACPEEEDDDDLELTPEEIRFLEADYADDFIDDEDAEGETRMKANHHHHHHHEKKQRKKKN